MWKFAFGAESHLRRSQNRGIFWCVNDILPEKLPDGYRRIEWAYRRQRWQRMVAIALLIARQGVSIVPEIARLTSIHKKSLHVVLDSMLNLVDPLIESRLLHVMGRGRIRVVSLSEYGKGLCRALGVEPIESDWEKIARLHNGDKQPKHAALILVAAYQARLRGWQAEVMPFDLQKTPWFQPDLKLIDPEGQFYYCEVETRNRSRPRKWARMRQINLIVPTPRTRRGLVERLKKMGIPGRATDLRTLIQQAKAGDLSQFWLEKW
jgi:hypothetical protein